MWSAIFIIICSDTGEAELNSFVSIPESDEIEDFQSILLFMEYEYHDMVKHMEDRFPGIKELAEHIFHMKMKAGLMPDRYKGPFKFTSETEIKYNDVNDRVKEHSKNGTIETLLDELNATTTLQSVDIRTIL